MSDEELHKKLRAGDYIRPCYHLHAHWMVTKEHHMETYWERSQADDSLWYAACAMCRDDAIRRGVRLSEIVEESRRPN